MCRYACSDRNHSPERSMLQLKAGLHHTRDRFVNISVEWHQSKLHCRSLEGQLLDCMRHRL